VIDLDPHGVSFQKVVEVALIAHEILEETGVKHYCKTSGGNGLHIFIPLHAKYSYEQSRQFAELISLCIQKKIPESTSLERSPKKRQKKVYLDCLQNRAAQTVVAPYVVRPRPKALISTPLTWKEVNKELDPSLFTIKTVLPRFKKKGDLFKDVLTARINMKAALAHLHKFK
jgi:bifunctional non-homologous end joining protein LigD